MQKGSAVANIKRYTLPIALAVISAVMLVVGILSLTVWKPPQEVVAQRSTEQPFTMTRAGVLPLYADKVEVRASVPESGDKDQTVWLAVGSADDVNAWLQEESYDEIVGLLDLQTLKAVPHIYESPADDSAAGTADDPATDPGTSEDPTGQSEDGVEPDAVPGQVVESPISSDMWTAVKYGRGSVSLTLSGDDMDMSLLAATDGEGPAPVISLRWETPQPNLLAIISFVLLGVVAALALFAWAVLFATRSRTKSAEDQGSKKELKRATEEAKAAKKADHSETEVIKNLATEFETDEIGADDIAEVADPIESADVEDIAQESANVPEIERDGAIGAGFEDEAGADTKADEHSSPDLAADAPVNADEDTQASFLEHALAESEDDGRYETVSTDSGMLNLSALQDGFAFPTRRALREAQSRGVDALVVEGRKFSTSRSAPGAPRPSVASGAGVAVPSTQPNQPTRQSIAKPADALRKRSMSAMSWSELMRRTADNEDTGTDGAEDKGE